MKKYILLQKFGSQLEAEHNSRKNCEKSLVILKVFVSITFYVDLESMQEKLNPLQPS
jgi:hypothetical protein